MTPKSAWKFFMALVFSAVKVLESGIELWTAPSKTNILCI